MIENGRINAKELTKYILGIDAVAAATEYHTPLYNKLTNLLAVEDYLSINIQIENVYCTWSATAEIIYQ